MYHFNKAHVFEPMKVHTFGPNIRLIRLFSLMLNYAKPQIRHKYITVWSLFRLPHEMQTLYPNSLLLA